MLGSVKDGKGLRDEVEKLLKGVPKSSAFVTEKSRLFPGVPPGVGEAAMRLMPRFATGDLQRGKLLSSTRGKFSSKIESSSGQCMLGMEFLQATIHITSSNT